MPKEIKSDLIEDKTIKLLHKFNILKDLTENELRILLGIEEADSYQKRIAKLVKYKPQEKVIKQGDFDSWVYWVVKGNFIVVKKKVPIAAFSHPGEVFGEMSILEEDNRRSATVISASKSVCLGIDMSILDNLNNENIRSKIKTGIDHLKSERLNITTNMLVEEKRKLTRQQKDFKLEMQRLNEKEKSLNQREQELLDKENMLASWEEKLSERGEKMGKK